MEDAGVVEERVERRGENHVNHVNHAAEKEGNLEKREEEGHVKKVVVEDAVKILVNNLINIYVEITLGAIFIVINS